jgi:hypothetical protein
VDLINVLPGWIVDTISIVSGVAVIGLFAWGYVWSQRPDRPGRKHRRRP